MKINLDSFIILVVYITFKIKYKTFTIEEGGKFL